MPIDAAGGRQGLLGHRLGKVSYAGLNGGGGGDLQWLQDGQPIPGAIAPTYSAGAVGTYSCQSSGANQAGTAASQVKQLVLKKTG